MTNFKPPLSDVTVFTRKGCHLCDEAIRVLKRYGIEPMLVDIDQDPSSFQRYNELVPVVTINGQERFRGRVNETLLRRIIARRKTRD
jgi:glutaredoxin